MGFIDSQTIRFLWSLMLPLVFFRWFPVDTYIGNKEEDRVHVLTERISHRHTQGYQGLVQHICNTAINVVLRRSRLERTPETY